MKHKSIYFYIPAIIFLLALWYVISLIVHLPIIPSPYLAIERLINIFHDTIAIHAFYSFWRIVAGVLLAVLIGVPIGILMGYTKKVDTILAPLVYLTYPIPKIALLPILMLLCGIGELPKILMIFLIVIFQVLVALRDGISSIPKEMFYPLYTLGASFKDIFCKILWPAVLPNFITALRVAMGTAISVLFFTETFGTKYGMGYFIMDAWLRVNYLDMYAGIIVLSLMGLCLFGILDLCERYFCKWNR